MALSMEKPATWAEPMPSAWRTAAASSAIALAEMAPAGNTVRPAPRLSKAVRR
jgi:hypothetical protein